MNEMVVDAKKPIGLEMVSLKMKKEHCLIFFFLVSMQLMVLKIKPTFALQVLNCKTNHTVV